MDSLFLAIDPFFLATAAYTLLAVALAYCFNKIEAKRKLKKIKAKRKLNLEPPATQEPGPSLFELIASQVKADPVGPLDYSRFPNINHKDLQFAPGAFDICIRGESVSDDWEIIVDAAKAVNNYQIMDWRVLEQNIKDIGAANNVDKVLLSLENMNLSLCVFWDLARESHDYEAVKWGIAIGSIPLGPGEVGDLMLFARHGEFTKYAVFALLRQAEKDNKLLEQLVELLPSTDQWSLIILINYIVTVQELIDRTDVQRDVLIYGMENNAGIPMEVAFTIAQAIQLETFFQEAREDERVFKAIVSLMDSLLTEPAPLGGIANFDNWQLIYDSYVTLLAHHETDIRVLWALRSMEIFLNDKDLPWNQRASELMRVRKDFAELFSVEVMRKGLLDQDNRWMAFNLIEQRQITELLPEITDLFKIDHDFQTIRILGAMGDTAHLELLLAAIPEIFDLEERAAIPFRSSPSKPDSQYIDHHKYKEILGCLGRLGTDEALDQVLRAGGDFHPWVRAAACKAIRSFPEEKITQAVKDMIEKCLSDPSEHVAKAAHDTEQQLGLP